MVALAGFSAIVVWVRWVSSSLTPTDQRVVLDSGILSRTSKAVRPGPGAGRASTRQSLLGRIPGYGAVETDAGAAGTELLDHLPMPNRIRDEVFVQSERLRHGSGQGQPAPSPAV